MSSSPREPLSRKLNNDGPRSSSSRRGGQEPLRETPSRKGGVSRSSLTRSQGDARGFSRSDPDRISGSSRQRSLGSSHKPANDGCNQGHVPQREKTERNSNRRYNSSQLSSSTQREVGDERRRNSHRASSDMYGHTHAKLSGTRFTHLSEGMKPSSRRGADGRGNTNRISHAGETTGKMGSARNGAGHASSMSRNELSRSTAGRNDVAHKNSGRSSSGRTVSGCTVSEHGSSSYETNAHSTGTHSSHRTPALLASPKTSSVRNAGGYEGTPSRSSSHTVSSRSGSHSPKATREHDVTRFQESSNNRNSSHNTHAHGRATQPSFLDRCIKRLPINPSVLDRFKRVFVIGTCVAALLCMLFGVDYAMNLNKIYSGVSIGAVDVSGMTKNEAIKAVDKYYNSHVMSNEALVFADKKAADEFKKGIDVFHEDQYSEEEHRSSRAWRVNAEVLSAELDSEAIVDRAYKAGRKGHRLDRLSCVFGGLALNPLVTMDDEKVEEYVELVASASGKLREENKVVIEDGNAYAVKGHDGVMPDRAELKRALTKILLNTNKDETILIPQLHEAPVSNSFEAAQTVAETINVALARPVTFTYKDVTFDVPRDVIGSWVTTELVGKNGSATLKPLIDSKLGQARLLNYADSHNISVSHSVKFTVKGDKINVHVTGADEIPQYGKAVEELNKALFETSGSDAQGPISIDITYGSVPTDMTFEQAREKGVISEISSYSTEYTPDVEGRNFNIHHMADFINNSVIPSKGKWSMLDTAGEISEKNGYKPGGQIVGDEVVQDYGGGVCQVATTVFNAVYESGFPIPLRYNHSLYMSVYPDGRDAAIAWPELDLVWENDSPSDVLLKAEYTDTSVTITLWGVNPGYVVQSATSEWKTADNYKVKITYDDQYAPGTDTVERAGQDGKDITVTRTVLDKDGKLIHEDTFYSKYEPVDMKIIRGGSGDPIVLTQESYQSQQH